MTAPTPTGLRLRTGGGRILGLEASGRLVGPPVFKTGVGARAPRRVRFPSASARENVESRQDPPRPLCGSVVLVPLNGTPLVPRPSRISLRPARESRTKAEHGLHSGCFRHIDFDRRSL